jgi:predicted nucleic acid-binding protein
MSARVKPARRRGYTKVSAKNQVTIPQDALVRAGLKVGDRLRAEELAIPASAYAEVLVGPFRQGASAVAKVDEFLAALPARVEPATREIAATAARLRAQHGTKLRLPDALVVATAVELGAAQLLTTDGGWPSLPIHVTVVGG